MAKKLLLCLPVFVILGIVSAAIGYMRPVAAERLFPGVLPEDCTEIQIYYGTDAENDNLSLTLTPEDDGFYALMELLCGQQFRRSLRNFLPAGTKTHLWQDGDYHWELSLRYDGISLQNGSVISGTLLHFNDFFGELTASFDGTDCLCTADRQDTWRGKVMDVILDAAAQQE